MTKTLEISFALKNAYRVNGILYSIKQIPIIKKLLPDSVYRVEGLKVFANVLSILWEVVSAFGGKLIYFFLMLFGADKIDWLQSDYCQIVVIILFLWKNLGYNMILFMAGLANIPKELLEVADVEGASEMYKFFNIKLRYLSPTVLFVTILSILSEVVSFSFLDFVTHSPMMEEIYSYLSLVMILSASSSISFSQLTISSSI